MNNIIDINVEEGWVQVQTNKLAKESILEAMSEGNYYASTGVELGELVINKNQIRLEIDESATKQSKEKLDHNQSNFTTTFIGVNGTVLHLEKGVSFVPFRCQFFYCFLN